MTDKSEVNQIEEAGDTGGTMAARVIRRISQMF